MSTTTPHDAHTLSGPAGCHRCEFLRENAHWMELAPEERARYTRMVPDQRAVDMAVAMLNTLPENDSPGTRDDVIAAIPMYFPGMIENFWSLDQEVCTVLGVVYAGRNSFSDEGDFPTFGWAREQAAQAAREALGLRRGVSAWATVHRDGQRPAVFTDRAFTPEGTS